MRAIPPPPPGSPLLRQQSSGDVPGAASVRQCSLRSLRHADRESHVVHGVLPSPLHCSARCIALGRLPEAGVICTHQPQGCIPFPFPPRLSSTYPYSSVPGICAGSRRVGPSKVVFTTLLAPKNFDLLCVSSRLSRCEHSRSGSTPHAVAAVVAYCRTSRPVPAGGWITKEWLPELVAAPLPPGAHGAHP